MIKMILTKICSKCGIEKPLTDFYINKSNKDGKNNKCIMCVKAYDIIHNQKVRDKKNAVSNQWYNDHKNEVKGNYEYKRKTPLEKAKKALYDKLHNENKKALLNDNEDTTIVKYESELRDYTENHFNTMGFGCNMTVIGKEYYLPIGIIDLLLKDKDDNLLVIEFKRDKSSDKVVGQLQRYMGYIRKEITKNVYGFIVMKDINDKVKYSVSENKNIKMYEYNMNKDITFTVNEVSL